MSYHTPSLNSMIEGKPRCAALTCFSTILFIYNASAYTKQSPVLSYHILNSLRPGDMSPSYWWTMVSPIQLRWRRHGLLLYQRCTAVCVFIMCRHWLEWWRAVCSDPCHQPSQWWYTVNWIPDWILRILSKSQQSSCENAFEILPANGGLSAAASMSYCHELQH